jgi:hypothetical protein
MYRSGLLGWAAKKDMGVAVSQVWCEAEPYPERRRIDVSGIHSDSSAACERWLDQGYRQLASNTLPPERLPHVEAPHAKGACYDRLDGQPTDGCQRALHMRGQERLALAFEAHCA